MPRLLLAASFLVVLSAATVCADLEVAWVADGAGVDFSEAYYIVTDPGRWRVMIDKATGAIFSFQDLTDPGVPTGDGVRHTDYLGLASSGTDYCYHLQAPLLQVEGCSGLSDRLFSRKNPLDGVADRLTFALSADKQQFVMTYSEEAGSLDFLWDPSTCDVEGVPSGERGDLLSTVTLTLSAAAEAGTIFRLVVTVQVQDPAGGSIDTRVFEEGWIESSIRSESAYLGYDYVIHQSIDGNASRADGPWDPAAPRSFIRRTVVDDENNRTLGLSPGRTFVLDYVQGFQGNLTGGTFGDGTWASGHYLEQQMPRGMLLTPGTVVTHVADLRINIVGEPAVAPLVIAASLGFDWVYQNASDGWPGHKSVLSVAITDGALAGETYDLTVRQSGGDVRDFVVIQPVQLVNGQVSLDLVGGLAEASTPSGVGQYPLTAVVSGRQHGQRATASVGLALRLLGDINGDGVLDSSDKLELNRLLNGIPTSCSFRACDLSGDGLVIDTEDKLVLNRILNGLLPH